MREFGVPLEHIVVEKMSGKNFQRPLYQKLIHRMQPEDILVVKSIDRLGRNYDEILEQWRDLTKIRHIAIVVLDMPLLDTRKDHDLTGTFVADIVLQILSYVAHQERENIRQRQAEGIAAALARGVHFGRTKMEMPDGFLPMVEAWQKDEISATAAAKALGISRQTFLRRAREYVAE